MSGSGDTVRFRVLGPISMLPHTPTAAKVRVLLATLLVRANEAVSTTALIDELWDIHPPRTAATTLQVYVSQLRRALGEIPSEPTTTERRLHTVPPGYRLTVSEEEFDLSRFETLRRTGKEAYDQGDYVTAAADLRESLSLWTGLALSGVPHGPVLATTSVRLEELRTVTLEQRIAADLRLGRHHELTGELMELVNQHPYRETLHAHLMVALYRSDRQSDALQAFARARKALVDELGVEPGAGLRRLHDRILRSDPHLAWQDPAPARPAPVAPALWLPPATADFTGREAALATAAKLLPGEEGQGPRVLVIGGRAGVGKTAFAAEFARRFAANFPDGQVLLPLRGGQDRPLDSAQTVLGLLHRLSTDSAAAPGDQEGSSAEGRPELAELTEQLHRAVEGRKLLLVLDDAASEDQLRPVLAAMPEVFTVVTSRRPLTGLDGARHLVLDVLRPSEAARLLTSIVGPRLTEDSTAAREIVRLCGCLPLAVRVAGSGLAARPHWSANDWADRLADEGAGLSPFVAGDLDVRASLLVGYREIGPAEQRAFRLLALAPVPDFPLWAAAALLDLPPAEAEQVVERLVESQLLSVRRHGPGQPCRYSYHRLLRTLALELLAADPVGAVEAGTERLATAYLSYAQYAAALLTPERAERPDGGGPGALSCGRIVGDNPARWFQEEAAGLVGAVRQAHAAGLWLLTWELTRALAGYFEAGSAWDEWAATHELALAAAHRAEHPGARAAVLVSLGDLAWQQRRGPLAAEHYETARVIHRELGDRLGEARCLVGLADVALTDAEPGPAGKLYAQAAELYGTEPAGQRGRVDVLRGLALAHLISGRTEEALVGFAEFVDAAQRLGDRRWAQFGSRSIDRIQEHMIDWAGGAREARPEAVEVRPGVWLVGDPQLQR
ncbi:Transcriptional activator [Kitasatospora sp. MMS16-BH015]|uniref:AfsR/SARP family transcriptional regulator n=1 Tax=Kitasatospora sp. MMS16-BH015 TaxID=2018025 RepID=UPI000CA26D8C|nr:AfsR/SARP family transcriptional regulator [Kitasatospora sp. MMS16-BH015]AUG78783.1 Transcriptional activator [Kitasatospora sp. MMS16-BH015]